MKVKKRRQKIEKKHYVKDGVEWSEEVYRRTKENDILCLPQITA